MMFSTLPIKGTGAPASASTRSAGKTPARAGECKLLVRKCGAETAELACDRDCKRIIDFGLNAIDALTSDEGGLSTAR